MLIGIGVPVRIGVLIGVEVLAKGCLLEIGAPVKIGVFIGVGPGVPRYNNLTSNVWTYQ